MNIFCIDKLNCVREILLLSIIIYFSQGAILPQGTIITQVLLLLIFAISIFYCIKIIFLEYKKSIFIWAWFLLLVLCIIGYFFTLDLSNPFYFGQIKAISLFFLPLFPFYYLAKNGKLTESHLLRFFIITLFVTILNFNHEKDLILESRFSNKEDVVNNISYIFAFLIPYIFLFKKNVISFFMMAIVSIFIIQGAKRGALIVGAVGILFFIYYKLSNIDYRYRVRSYALSFFAIISLIAYLYKYFLSNDFLISRLSKIEEGGSGRDIIYSNLLKAWYNSDNILNFIFGYGFSSTLKFSGTGHFAHNDWLELLTNFGILGISLYLIIFFGLLEIAFRKGFKKEYKVTLLAITCMWFVTTLFSMIFNTQYSILFTLIIAFLIGRNKFKKNVNSF